MVRLKFREKMPVTWTTNEPSAQMRPMTSTGFSLTVPANQSGSIMHVLGVEKADAAAAARRESRAVGMSKNDYSWALPKDIAEMNRAVEAMAVFDTTATFVPDFRESGNMIAHWQIRVGLRYGHPRGILGPLACTCWCEPTPAGVWSAVVRLAKAPVPRCDRITPGVLAAA